MTKHDVEGQHRVSLDESLDDRHHILLADEIESATLICLSPRVLAYAETDAPKVAAGEDNCKAEWQCQASDASGEMQ